LSSPTALDGILAAVVRNVATGSIVFDALPQIPQPSEPVILDVQNIESSLSYSAFNADALPDNLRLARSPPLRMWQSAFGTLKAREWSWMAVFGGRGTAISYWGTSADGNDVWSEQSSGGGSGAFAPGQI
jgi:hypothetical protein